MLRLDVRLLAWSLAACVALVPAVPAAAQGTPSSPATDDEKAAQAKVARDKALTFDMGQIVVVGSPDGTPGVGGAVLSREQMWNFDRNSLDQAVNLIPGVVSNMDSNGRRNESDIFVRGFGRWQVPLMLDGVRIYLPADNRLDFARFLTADIAEVQVQKGYASVLDGPGAMGGAINLVTRKPAKAFELEGSAGLGGRSDTEGWNAYVMAGTRQPKFYLQGSANYADRDFWTLSSHYTPTANSLQPAGRRLSSDSADSRLNFKAGITPNQTDEYSFDFIQQEGEKGGPLNVITNPPVPPNSYWRWPYWDIRNMSVLTKTQLGSSAYVKGKLYFNTFKNGLDAFDDGTYTTQSANGRFRSPYDDHASGHGLEFGVNQKTRNTIKAAWYYRTDVHTEQQINRPTNPTSSTTEPVQTQSLNTWSFAVEDTAHLTSTIELVGGVSYADYEVTRAEEFNTTRGLFEYPKGGATSFDWQSALVWHYSETGQVYGSVSDRGRFPILFELYSTRFGTATPNPNVGPERATNVDFGWKGRVGNGVRLEGTVFYSDVNDLIQTVQLPDTTTQYQNVGNGTFYGAEVAADIQANRRWSFGGNYVALSRTIHDGLQPNLRPTGVPSNKAFLYLAWRPTGRLAITPSLDVSGDRWSDMTTSPVTAFPYVRTGQYTLLNLSAQYTVARNADVVFGLKNMTDQDYALSWGLPQPGRTFYVKTRVGL